MPYPLIHGGPVEHQVWRRMVGRCTDKRDPGYRYYGSKGFSVDPRWLGPHGFENFIADIGKRPAPDLALRRIDKSGNFDVGNVTWGRRGRGAV